MPWYSKQPDLKNNPLYLEPRITANETSLAESETKQGDLAQLNTADKSSIVNALKEVKTQANSKADQSSLATTNGSVSTLQTQVTNMGSGSPKGTHATLSALQTAFPTGTTGTYVVTADGKWYYWNGTSWMIGGTYQSTGISDKSVTSKSIDDTVLRNSIKNLKDTSYFGSISALGGSYTVDGSGVNTITTTASWGRLIYSFPNVSQIKTLVIMGKVRTDDVNMVGKTVSDATYCLDSAGTNLGLATGSGTETSIKLSSVWQTFISKPLTALPNTERIDAGISGGGVGTFQIKDFYIADITGFDSNDLSKIDFSSFYNRSGNSVSYKSLVTEYANNANTSNIATYANDGPFIKPVQKYQNFMGDFATLLLDSSKRSVIGMASSDFSNGIASGTPNLSYGAIRFYSPAGEISQGRKYLFTANIKSDNPTSVAMSCYKYQDTTQLGLVQGTTVNIDSNWKRITQILTLNDVGVNSVLQGVLNTKTSPYEKFYIKDYMVIDITDNDLSESDIDGMGGYWREYPQITLYAESAKTADISLSSQTKWNAKNILAIGDSLTAALKWQSKVTEIHGCTVTTHAKGGIGLIPMVDGDGAATDPIPALTSAQVSGKDLIVLFGGMNERSLTYGLLGDLYPSQNTLYGRMQYVINKIYSLLKTANNLTCKILIVTPHCCGKYNYIDVDGYGEYPAATGQTLEKLVNNLKTCANYNNLRVVDLWHNSGVGKNTWSVYMASAVATITPPGGSTAPYPANGDQVHFNDTGYALIGQIIGEEMNML